MMPLAFDTETALIRPAVLAPPMACLTWCSVSGTPPTGTAHIAHVSAARAHIESWLLDPGTLLVGHNVAYDMGVVCQQWPDLVPLVFRAYQTDRVTDTQIRQQLLDIASGVYRGRTVGKGIWIQHNYDLESLAKRCAGMQLTKDAWRLSYGEFLDVPLESWSEHARIVQVKAAARLPELEARFAEDLEDTSLQKEIAGLKSIVQPDPSQCIIYPKDDAWATALVHHAQEKHADYLHDQFRQARAAWALHLSSAWGLRTDRAGVDILRAETEAQLEELETEMLALGFVRPDGSRDTKAVKARMIEVCAREGATLRRTDGHEKPGKCKRLDGTSVPDGSDECEDHVCLDADACESSGDEALSDYAELSTLKKVLNNDVAALEKGVEYPVHTRYGLAGTGRTTSSKPNIQNLRRQAGIREAFVPRPGKVFVACDYPQLELYTLAQCCVSWLGRSKLAEALNAGMDPHLALAAKVLGLKYDDAKARYDAGDTEVDDVRQVMKKINFGMPGGMGVPKFEATMRKELNSTEKGRAVLARLGIDREKLKGWRQDWLEQWSELPHYFARVNAMCETASRKAFVETLFHKAFRGDATYCAACNNGFQALGADCAKEAAFRIATAQYVGPSGLYGTRTVAFVHDEFVIEADARQAHEAGECLADVMVSGANVYLPDVPIPRSKCKPVAMLRWSKKAAPRYDASGRLVPWDMAHPVQKL